MGNLDQNVMYGSFDYDVGTLYLAATEKGLCFVGSLNESLRELEDGVGKLFPKAVLVEKIIIN